MADLRICPNCDGIEFQELIGPGACICAPEPKMEESNHLIIFVFVLPLILLLCLILIDLIGKVGTALK